MMKCMRVLPPPQVVSRARQMSSTVPALYPRPSTLLGALTDRISDTLSDATSKALLLEQEKLVTELRRPLELRYHTSETLAERLEHQRNIRGKLIPTHINVDKSRMYMEFIWPIEAVVAAEKQRMLVARREAQGGEAAEGADTAVDVSPPQELLRAQTRGLAEYLRAYTTSTDGAFGDGRNLIYGRRGLTIKDAYPVGQYALRIVFSDDHSGGIYPYEYLYQLTCPFNKMTLMRQYIRVLRERKKSRDPPNRRVSRRRLDKSVGAAAAAAAATSSPSLEAHATDEYTAPAFEKKPKL